MSPVISFDLALTMFFLILFNKPQAPPLLLLYLNSCILGTESLFLLAENSQSTYSLV